MWQHKYCIAVQFTKIQNYYFISVNPHIKRTTSGSNIITNTDGPFYQQQKVHQNFAWSLLKLATMKGCLSKEEPPSKVLYCGTRSKTPCIVISTYLYCTCMQRKHCFNVCKQ